MMYNFNPTEKRETVVFVFVFFFFVCLLERPSDGTESTSYFEGTGNGGTEYVSSWPIAVT